VAAVAGAEGVVSLLELREVAFGYPRHPVGRDVSLSLRPGEVVALLGPNGSGKTTLFRTILGWLRPSAGAVELSGRPLGGWSRRERARLMGYVPQAHGALFAFTVLDVVLMGRTSHLPVFGVPTRRDREEALRALDSLGAAALAPRVYVELSGGERQLVLVARALAQEPRLLVMDEPTSNLDFGNQIRLLDQVATLGSRGIAVLMSTHHPDHARRVASRVVLLKGGQVAGDGPPAEMLSVPRLAGLYDVDPARLAPPGAAGAPGAR
jgi:iron complex transport system ATP-binding protein